MIAQGRDEFYEIFREVSMKNALLYTTQTSPPNSTLETLRSQIVNGRTAADIAMQRKGEDKAHNATQPDRLSAKKGDDYFSPRHHFLTEVVNKHLPPRANYVIRKAVFPVGEAQPPWRTNWYLTLYAPFSRANYGIEGRQPAASGHGRRAL